ncbi:trypsin-like peptidase domain-containing protein [Microbacter sp. GSS18]|nr:trypsin-like peptidase domain-containing protein [Microbacter sp. GSS18]
MSDDQGERPEDQTPQTPAATPEAGAADAGVGASETRTVPPVPPVPPAPQGGWAAPTPPPPPPAGYAPGAAYAHPQGYAPPAGTGAAPSAHPAPAPGYTGAAFTGAFGPATATADAQATTPIDGGAAAPTEEAPQKQKSGAGKVAALIVAAALVGGAAGLGGAYAGVNLFSTNSAAPAAGPVTVTVNDTESVNQTAGIAAKVVPSVVTIYATGASGSGTGSGVVLSSDGYVVTNTHVVTLDGATGDAAIRVTTSDGRVYDATVVGTDPTYDLAVIKLTDATDLTPIDFGDSSALNVGDETVAVGAPLGLPNTVTTGIVSALNRSIEIASSAAPDSGDGSDSGGQDGETPFFFDFGQGSGSGSANESIKIAVIQTDAAINPGNSGGALVDSSGDLIGINVAIASAGGSSGTAGSIGVGFSIPSDIVQRITDDIIADGTASHGLLGASVQSAAYVDGVTITGAYVADVTADGAAAAAGIQAGDIVTGFNGVPITDSVDLTAQVRAAAAGSDATVTYVRGDQSFTVDVTLGSLTQ